MTKTVEGTLSGTGMKVAVVASRFNDAITDRLVTGAVDALARHGVGAQDVTVVRVPGAFEIPLAARILATAGGHDAVVCVGALIRGATAHFDVLASSVTSGLSQVMLDSGVPIGFGVLTCDSLEQALERAGGKGGNKGFDAAVAAVEMTNLTRSLTASA